MVEDVSSDKSNERGFLHSLPTLKSVLRLFVNEDGLTFTVEETVEPQSALNSEVVLRIGVICDLSLLVFSLASRVFLRVLRFSSLRKNQHF
jgi:hypothetical protein